MPLTRLPTHTIPEDSSFARMCVLFKRLKDKRTLLDPEGLDYIEKELQTITEDEWERMALHPSNEGHGSWTSQLYHELRMLVRYPHDRMERTCQKLKWFMQSLKWVREQRSLHDHLKAALIRIPDSPEIKELACLKQSLLQVPESALVKLQKTPGTINDYQTALGDINALVLNLVQPFTEVQSARSFVVSWKDNADSFLGSLQQHNEHREQAERAIERIRNLVTGLLGHEWSMIWNENARELGLPPPGFPKPAHHIQAALSHSRRRFTPVARG